MEEVFRAGIQDFAREVTTPEPPNLKALELETHANIESPQMLTGRLEGRFLKLLVQMCAPKVILEIGTFTGYSGLSMAEGLADDGKLITCEINPKAQAIAQKAFDASPHGNKIEIRMGPALDTIRDLQDPIDFCFIDADKVNYPNYYEAVIERMRSGGVIVLDNMLWSGRVLDPQDEDSRVLAKLNRTIAADDRVENVLLTVRDGIQLVRKR